MIKQVIEILEARCRLKAYMPSTNLVSFDWPTSEFCSCCHVEISALLLCLQILCEYCKQPWKVCLPSLGMAVQFLRTPIHRLPSHVMRHVSAVVLQPNSAVSLLRTIQWAAPLCPDAVRSAQPVTEKWKHAIYDQLYPYVFFCILSCFVCCYGRPLSVSGRPCYILPKFLFIYLFIYFYGRLFLRPWLTEVRESFTRDGPWVSLEKLLLGFFPGHH